MKKLLVLLVVGVAMAALTRGSLWGPRRSSATRDLKKAVTVPYTKYLKKLENKKQVLRPRPRTAPPGPNDSIDIDTLMQGLAFLQRLLGDNGSSLLTGLLSLPEDSRAQVPSRNRVPRPTAGQKSDPDIFSALRNFKADENVAFLRELFGAPSPTPPANSNVQRRVRR